jgi:hypothetical protein
LRPALVSGSYSAYIEPCVLFALEEREGRACAYLEVPSDLQRQWLIHRMAKVLPRAISEQLDRRVQVVYCLPGEVPTAPADPPPDVSGPPSAARQRAPPPGPATPSSSAKTGM